MNGVGVTRRVPSFYLHDLHVSWKKDYSCIGPWMIWHIFLLCVSIQTKMQDHFADGAMMISRIKFDQKITQTKTKHAKRDFSIFILG